MSKVINLNVPTAWAELSQEQLHYILDCMVRHSHAYNNVAFISVDDYNSQMFAMVATSAITQWCKLSVVCPYAEGWLLKTESKEEFFIDAESFASLLSALDWLRSIPSTPVRLDHIGNADAVAPEIISDIIFEDWLACENYWQRYAAEQNDQFLSAIAEILYPDENRNEFNCSPAELLGVFYWYSSAKAMISAMFPSFFRAAAVEPNTPTQLSIDSLRKVVDAQIRALTKGDITKEHEVLNMSALRALTELDALAREYEELNKKFNVKK